MRTRTRNQHSGSDADEDGSVVILNRQRFRRVDQTTLARFAQKALADIGRGDDRVTITLVSDQKIRSLNRTYRDIDQPTDVLAFPDEPAFPHEVGGVHYLGDVVISTETAARYAAKFRISFDRELRNLIIHGLLHLCGYDHEADQGEMRQLERRVRRKLIKERGTRNDE